MVFIPRQLQEKCQEQNKGLLIMYIHLTKTFDIVSREEMCKDHGMTWLSLKLPEYAHPVA